ncbi:MAG: hypothetical protein LQ343_001811 [Gyalolechia ehrenbergii]|nr:MAG: hypothetical protein LQ343_001811 [Gyalolechia ehrenbergii]
MEVHKPVMDHPKKRRRRRRSDRPPLSVTLIPDTSLKGEEALLSADLDDQLFSWSAVEEHPPSEPRQRYIAISPWVPQSSDVYHHLPWTILPRKLQSAREEYDEVTPDRTVRYPASSPALPSILSNIRPGTINRESVTANKGLRILVLDVEPVELTNVYVTVDGNALARHEQIQKEFGGGFASFPRANLSDKSKGKGKAKAIEPGQISCRTEHSTKQQQDKELTDAVRSALGSLSLVRQGDCIPLPLPAHPITHAPLPPARIILCEPVSHGLLSAETKVIVNRQFGASKPSFGKANRQLCSPSYQALTESGDETLNEQFFSALEDGVDEKDEADEVTPDSSSPGENSDYESSESTDDMISLSTPGLLNQAPSLLSSVGATPRVQGSAVNGTSTPGSRFSSFTAKIARQSSGVSKIFRASGLLAQVPNDLLHPKPDGDEDDESRVYVDVKDLMRLKCFSGDWVKLRAAPRRGNDQFKSWNMNVPRPEDDHHEDYRTVKIYGLEDLTPRHSIRCSKKATSLTHRRSSVNTYSQFKRPTPQAWLSPILLSNLDCPAEIMIAPLTPSIAPKQPFSPKYGSNKADHPQHPPLAAEVSLAKVSTPISQESALQDMLFSTLKKYFEAKRRIVKKGDLVAMTIDANIGRILGPSSSAVDNGKDMDEFLCLLTKISPPSAPSLEVVWFKVGQISRSLTDTGAGYNGEDIWGGAACVDPTVTRMTIGASRQCRIPSDSQISWKSYLGVIPSLPSRISTCSLSRYMSTSPRPYTSSLLRRLRELIAAATSPRAVHLGIQPTLILLYSNQRHIGKARMATQAASSLGIHTFTIESYEVIGEGNAGEVQESSINTRLTRGLSCGAQHTTILIRHLEALTGNRLTTALQVAAKNVRVLIATTTQLDQVSENLRSLFTHEIEMSAPDEGEREGILQNIITEQSLRIAHDVDLSAIAVKTAALVAGNLVDIVERAVIARQIRLEKFIQTISTPNSPRHILVRDLVISGGEWAQSLTTPDFNLAVDAARKNFADSIGAPKIPNVSWDDVGGLEHVKDAVMETIQLPLERPELFAIGMKKRSGILFYGPPGTGKTLLAKAIATEFSLNFFSVKGPELLNMYIGESEANVRRVFQRARDARPCVVFFDELDSVAPKRGNQGDSGGVMDRIVSQLLAELDGMSSDSGGSDDSGSGRAGGGGGGVFVIGATNRPDLLDQALLRPGRFDKMLYLGISDTHQKQLTILEALTRKFSLHPDLSLARVAESLPFTYTGADLYALCSDAMLKAITRQAEAVDAKIKALPNGPVSHAFFFDNLAKEDDVRVVVTEEDFYSAKKELVGSVSAQELEHYQRVRRSFEIPSKPPPSTPLPTRPQPSRRTDTAIRTQPQTFASESKGKGKGKAPVSQSASPSEEEEEDNDDDDEAYVTSNDSLHASPERGVRHLTSNDSLHASPERDMQGKGKQKATMIPRPRVGYGFQEGGLGEEEDMYR